MTQRGKKFPGGQGSKHFTFRTSGSKNHFKDSIYDQTSADVVNSRENQLGAHLYLRISR